MGDSIDMKEITEQEKLRKIEKEIQKGRGERIKKIRLEMGLNKTRVCKKDFNYSTIFRYDRRWKW